MTVHQDRGYPFKLAGDFLHSAFVDFGRGAFDQPCTNFGIELVGIIHQEWRCCTHSGFQGGGSFCAAVGGKGVSLDIWADGKPRRKKAQCLHFPTNLIDGFFFLL